MDNNRPAKDIDQISPAQPKASVTKHSVHLFQEDESEQTSIIQQRPLPIPPPLPTSPPPEYDPKPWFEIDPEETITREIKRVSNKKHTAPQPPTRKSPPTDTLPVLSSPATNLAPFQYDKLSKPNANSDGNSAVTVAPKVIKIGDTTPPPVQKPSRIRAIFGMSPPVSSSEPPKPKTRRIRVPKQNSPKPLPRTIASPGSNVEKVIIKSSPSPKSKSTKADHPTSPKAKEIKSSNENRSYDRPSTNKKALVPKTKEEVSGVGDNTLKPKQLSFAENATVYSDDEVSMMGSLAEQNDNDSWDLVAKHRASISQNADQFKAATSAKVRQLHKSNGHDKRIDYVSVDKPKTMREMRKSQSVGAGVNLKNKDIALVKEGAVDSDTEA